MGRLQFFEDQSLGIKPKNPDLYYLQLDSGKCNFDITTRTMQQEYIKSLSPNGGITGWFGWASLKSDWIENQWVLPYILKWADRIIDVEKFIAWDMDAKVPDCFPSFHRHI